MMSAYERFNARYTAADAAQAKLATAFAAIRKEGVIARQRFSCCRSCAGVALANEVEVKIDAGKKPPKGAVFYSKQQGFLQGSGRRAEVHKLFLSFGSLHTEKHGEIGDTLEVGKIVCKALTDVGLAFKWDEDPDKCIEIDPCPTLWD